MHGFDEFFGNLYHLNAEEEPYYEDYPKDPKFREKYGPRGVRRCKADGKGGQTIENTGPMPKERMETVDEEFLAAAKDFIKRKHADGGPWFCYFNSTRMHVWTHLKEASRGNGHNLLPYLKGDEPQSPREGFLYWSDDGDLLAVRRYDDLARNARVIMNVSLTPELEKFVEGKVESGLYNNASEVIREGLRLLKEHDEVRLKWRKQIERGWIQAQAGQVVDGPKAMRDARTA